MTHNTDDEVSREAIARIIDPKNWALYDSIMELADQAAVRALGSVYAGDQREDAESRVKGSLTKADAILARITSQETAGNAGEVLTSSAIERAWVALAERPCETAGLEDMEAGCCAPCRARAALATPVETADNPLEDEALAEAIKRLQCSADFQRGCGHPYFPIRRADADTILAALSRSNDGGK